ncbi:hypothetical protein PHLCEN_2v11388 [Hermanssonia centrifuga]|uniref:Uncharacterized protein n=1 Tax=Hermanssonia centrifuga TaxID=98765 RepID=A0A2R6NK08_9APHY|nr:hypothetical protein PHLCEN_2v11388 [Hermanssonia centrifuga]
MRSSTPTRKDTESQSAASPSPRKSRFTKLMFDIRTMVREPQIVPMQPPPWPPLHVEKRQCSHDCPCRNVNKKKQRRRRIFIIILILIILYLLGNTVALNIRVFGSPPSAQPPHNSTASTSTALSSDAQQCLSQYTVNAPSNPGDYPCSTCLPVLQSVPSNFSDGNAQDTQQIENAVQFCGLRSIFETADSDGQSALKNGNWAQDVKFCAWDGVSCDGMGRVSSLSLTFPGVPGLLPSELGALSGLQSLTIIGNSATPCMFTSQPHVRQ